jgi:hypothetical protein
VGSRRLISNREACPTQSSPFEGYPNNLRPLSSYHETRSFSSAVQRQRVIKSGCFDVNNYHLTLDLSPNRLTFHRKPRKPQLPVLRSPSLTPTRAAAVSHARRRMKVPDFDLRNSCYTV